MRRIFHLFRRSHIIFRLIAIIFIVSILFGTIIHIVEPETFPTIFDGIWWVIITTSTIGYGDFIPATHLGKVITIILILLGATFVTFYMVKLASTVFEVFNAFQQGSATYKGKDHLIVIGWNERTKNTIHQLKKMKPHVEIVLIDSTLKKSPLPFADIHFIKGNSFHDETLRKANVEKAETVLITADQHRNEQEADMQTILTLLALKGLNPTIYSVVEILTQEQVNNAKRAGADEIIESYLLSSYVMVTNLNSPGLSKTIESLLDLKQGGHLHVLKETDLFINKTFSDCLQQLIAQNILLIGVKRGEESFINPPPSFIIEKNDCFLVIIS